MKKIPYFAAVTAAMAIATYSPAQTTPPTQTNSSSQVRQQIEPATSVFSMARLHPAHRQLVGFLKKAIAARDYAAMDAIASRAVEIFPDDATWRYNLACSRTRTGKPREALEILAEAVRLGFTDASAIAADGDLAVLRRDKAFSEILETARDLHAHPEKKARVVKPEKIAVGKPALVGTGNTTWDMENGGFVTLFAVPAKTSPTPTNLYARLPGRAGERLREWQEEGTAAGNWGDFYDNLDRGHSSLDRKLFPEITPIKYCPAAVSNGLDNTGATLFSFAGQMVIGNSSTAMTAGPSWRSVARLAQNENLRYLVQQYLNNQIYVYPQHRDYLPTIAGDVFPSRTPYIYISNGSSWTDRPILNALAAALCAMRPEVKAQIVRGHIAAPVLRYLIMSSQKDIFRRADYLVPSSHPMIMNGDKIDMLRLVESAHALDTNSLPPIVGLRVLHEEGAGKEAGLDFFDLARGERLADTPFAVARVFRGMNHTRKYTLEAAPIDPRRADSLKYHWIVVQGDQDKIRITPRDESMKVVDLEIDYHRAPFDTPFGMMSSRVDVALVADDGTHYSPEAFFSCFFLANEARTYSESGKILGVDYTVGRSRYVDPVISLPKNWSDIYTYDANGRLSGWTRVREGAEPEAFTEIGEKVVKPAAAGKPAVSVPVKYVTKTVETPDGPGPELVETEADR